MSTPSGHEGVLPKGVSDQVVRDHLAKILGSEVFSRSERLSAFLRFVVEETLAGRGNTLREQFLAVALYGRSADPTSDDSIVRTDARRLRDKLRAYYAESGDDPVIIIVPKGSYTPVFERNPSTAVTQAPATPDTTLAPVARRPGRPLTLWLSGAAIIAIITIAVWHPWHKSGAPPQIVRLTYDAGGELEPSLSPDGNFVAYAWTGPVSPGPQDIWIRAVNSDSRRQLTETPGPISENAPAWSPDGKEIAFARVGYAGQSIANAGVYVVSVLGGAERRISSSGRNPAWTPDGHGLLIRDRVDSSSPAGIFHIDLRTLGRRQITQAPSGDGDWKCDVSPDGAMIAFIRFQRSGVSDIYTVPVGGGEPRRLTNWGSFISGLTWTPDGREIVFDVAGQSLWRIAARSRFPGRGTPEPGLAGLVTSAALASAPVVSRPAPGTAARLAFQVEVISVGLRMIDLQTPTTGGVLPAKSFVEGRRVDLPGPFSPDGGKVAFSSYSAGSQAQLWTVARDGAGLRQMISPAASTVGAGSWSPDGRRIAFDAAVAGNSDIYVSSENGGEPKRLTTDAAMEIYPSWSHDGRWIYYSSDRTGRHEVFRLPSDGGPSEQITRQGGVHPLESMDRNHLFYLDELREPGVGVPTTKLKTVPTRGGEERTILEIPRLGRLALWGITSRGIFFATPEAEFDAINLYPLPAGPPVRVGRLSFRIPKQFPRMTFSPDGRWALTNQVDRREADLMMIENFR